jgi:hypothetical protein
MNMDLKIDIRILKFYYLNLEIDILNSEFFIEIWKLLHISI